jgi:predicted enzyme related to lactoylglutathione lyase
MRRDCCKCAAGVARDDIGFGVRRCARFLIGCRITSASGMENSVRWGIGSFSGIVFGCDDIVRTCKELAERGVAFKHMAEKQPWGGMMAQFYDADHNTFVLVGN